MAMANVYSSPSPLSIPLLSGFNRTVFETYSEGIIRKTVKYSIKSTSGPGRESRERVFTDVQKLHEYLLETKVRLHIDTFCFNPKIDISFAYDWDYWRDFTVLSDFSNGREYHPIPVVNTVDAEIPQIENYVVENLFAEEITQNNSNAGLSSTCCNCENDCKDKLKCPCFQLTLANYNQKDRKIMGDENIGYDFKRLPIDRKTLSGIFECNSKCKCNQQHCLNRVVQNGTKWRLQLFKNNGEKGWGVRALNDIPNGAFVSKYTGMIFEEYPALSRHWQTSDRWKYLLDLAVTKNNQDLIEMQPERPASSSGVRRNNNVSSLMDTPNKCFRKVYSSVPRKGIFHAVRSNAARRKASDAITLPKRYVLDGKRFGNIGRFFNHSCESNMFPQYVFVNTHDLRFPIVSFFAAKDIRAGDELTWCYNYQSDTTKGRSTTPIDCLCRRDNCVRKFC